MWMKTWPRRNDYLKRCQKLKQVDIPSWQLVSICQRVHRYFIWDWMKRFIFVMFNRIICGLFYYFGSFVARVHVFFIHEKLFILWQFVNSQTMVSVKKSIFFFLVLSAFRFFLLPINKNDDYLINHSNWSIHSFIHSFILYWHKTMLNHKQIENTFFRLCDSFSFP